MLNLRSIRAVTVRTGAALALTAAAARADGRPLFVWSGTVDREAVIVMRGAVLETQGDGFEAFRAARFRVAEALPQRLGSVHIDRADGRGEIEVIQQPSPFNSYTTRIRVRDRQSGADRYRLVVSWEGARNRGWGDGRDDDWNDRDRNDRERDERDRNDRDRPAGYGRSDAGRDDGLGSRRDAGALHFSAFVDDVAEIRIRGRRVEAFARSGRSLSNVRYDVRGASLPEYALPLDLRRFAGRGNVTIAQYPREWNNWTAIIRIDDSRGGADGYDFDLRW